jgi:formylglycine-generating enzyme required for sulfatase activity
MSIPVLCPRCDFAMEQPTGQTVPSSCPACGQRLTCPRCGSTLQSGGGETRRLECTSCHLHLEDADTVPLPAGAATATAPQVRLPGFELGGEIGRGGMGIVYRAHQLNLHRDVAIKVLPPALAANSSALERFRNEAMLAGRLVDAHILPIFDVQEVDGLPVIVMPLIEGCDLGRVVRDRVALQRGKVQDSVHPWAHLDDRAYLDKIFPLLDQMIAAVKALHAGGVLHRDIKPSNVLVDHKGSVWLSDFGLARLEEDGTGTVLGQGIGTAAYSSPEQARGHDIDFRADLFSIGVTLYQILTLELPFGKYGAQGTLVSPPRPSVRQPLLARDYDAVLLKAIQRDPDKRYGSIAELEEDWKRVRQGLLPKAGEVRIIRRAARAMRRHPWRVAVAGVVVLLAVALGVAALPRDRTEYRDVIVETDPPGAKVVMVPLDPMTGNPMPDRAIRRPAARRTIPSHVPVGPYLIVAVLEEDGRFQEVYRTVPPHGQPPGAYHHVNWTEDAGGIVSLAIKIPEASVTKGMVRLAGGDFVMGGVTGAPPYPVTLEPYYLDTTEVSVRAWRDKIGGLPPPLADKRPLDDDFAVTYVTFDEALDFAERMGKRLPDEAEYEFAARNGGKTQFPWGDEIDVQDWRREKVGKPSFDHTLDKPPVFGLFSNVAEWTASWNVPYPTADPDTLKAFYSDKRLGQFLEGRIVRGGPIAVVRGSTDVKAKPGAPPLDPRHRHGISHDEGHPGLGFRCARSERPRYTEP